MRYYIFTDSPNFALFKTQNC